ncbi:hypothetical protein O3M35_001811 [Rhynocoris fuscipes]|uniref:DDB1- and CUL4-associated factor 15 WD40 repeat-containing domain-containing protein n=1 Tax=Rhynocoris fuscipes TaxID=488301 RepID=A0AAW1CNT2_9HEMI
MKPAGYRKQHLLQKLYNRELFGHFIRGVSLRHDPARQLFPTVPERLIFNLSDTIPNVGKHILMGATRCGQLLLTYTCSVDPASDFPPTVYRYRLHFWAFRPNRAAAKVAEVQLFDGVQVTEVLTIGIVQWPNDNDRLLVFGSCHEAEYIERWVGGTTDCEYKSTTYITVTTVPSLNGCIDCRAVAASFDEEEMAANWDSGVGLTCLRHGFTAHTHFSVPYIYTFDPHSCLYSPGNVLINTGAFLHVLGFSVEKGGSSVARIQTNFDFKENIVNVPPVNRLSYSYLRDRCYSIFLSEDWACNMTQLLMELLEQGRKIEMEDLPFCLKYALQKHFYIHNSPHCHPSVVNKCKLLKNSGLSIKLCGEWPINKLIQNGSRTLPNVLSLSTAYQQIQQFQLQQQQQHQQQQQQQQQKDVKKETSSAQSAQSLTCNAADLLLRTRPPPKQRCFFSSNKNNRLHTGAAFQARLKTVKRASEEPETVYDFMESEDNSCEPKFKLFRRRCLADKMYEFRSEEEHDYENIRPPDSISYSCKEKFKLFRSHNDKADMGQVLEVSSDKADADDKNVCRKNTENEIPEMNTTVKAIIADWDGLESESESEVRNNDVLSFINGLEHKRRCSPPSKSNTRRSISRRILSGSPLKLHNSTSDTSSFRRELRVHPRVVPVKMNVKKSQFDLTDEMLKEMEKGFGHQPVSGCSVRFTRRYIEIDQEITSTITDIEDDDIGTGFHCALPLSVHGSAYAQMEMISNQKAEKLGIWCAVVRQSSLDIEQFCYKAAESICNMEGYKFWFFSDYETEVVRACPLTGDILSVLFIRLNAENMRLANNTATELSLKQRADLRNFYETRCLYVWSPLTGRTYLEGYTSLVKVSSISAKKWGPAAKEAKCLRESANGYTRSGYGIAASGCTLGKVRAFVHTMKDGRPVPSVNLILDHDNLIGFRRDPLPSLAT